MNRIRGWLIGVAAAFLLAGFAVGLALPRAMAAVEEASGLPAGDEAYAASLVEAYALDKRQSRLLRMILRKRYEEEHRIFRDNRSDLPEIVRRQLEDARRREQKRIEYMLNDRQREKYRQDLERDTGR